MKSEVVAAVLVLFIAFGVAVGYFAGVASQRTVTSVSHTTTTTTQVTTIALSGVGPLNQCGLVKSCFAVNPSGLMLVLSINATSVRSNGSLTFDISEFNPTARHINLSSSDNWYLDSLSWPCNGGSIPYGVAAFKGHYTLQNVTTAENVLKFAPYFCVYTGNPTSFSIPSMSTFQPPYEFNSAIYAINGGSVNSGNYSALVNSLGSSKPAAYTLAAGDEWGDLVLLYFSVAEGNQAA